MALDIRVGRKNESFILKWSDIHCHFMTSCDSSHAKIFQKIKISGWWKSFSKFCLSLYSIIIGWRFKTKGRSVLQQRPVDLFRRVLVMVVYFCDPRSIFDLAIPGQRSIFGHFSGKSKFFFTFQSRYWQNYERYRHGTFTSVFPGHFSTSSHAF